MHGQTTLCINLLFLQRNTHNSLRFYLLFIQGDSLARGPKLLSIKNYVNQLTDDELTTGYYQQDGATCHTSNVSMREIESFFKTELS